MLSIFDVDVIRHVELGDGQILAVFVNIWPFLRKEEESDFLNVYIFLAKPRKLRSGLCFVCLFISQQMLMKINKDFKDLSKSQKSTKERNLEVKWRCRSIFRRRHVLPWRRIHTANDCWLVTTNCIFVKFSTTNTTNRGQSRNCNLQPFLCTKIVEY